MTNDGIEDLPYRLLLILVLLLVIGMFPVWPYSVGWGYYPSGGFGALLVILLVSCLALELDGTFGVGGEVDLASPSGSPPASRAFAPSVLEPIRLHISPSPCESGK